MHRQRVTKYFQLLSMENRNHSLLCDITTAFRPLVSPFALQSCHRLPSQPSATAFRRSLPSQPFVHTTFIAHRRMSRPSSFTSVVTAFSLQPQPSADTPRNREMSYCSNYLFLQHLYGQTLEVVGHNPSRHRGRRCITASPTHLILVSTLFRATHRFLAFKADVRRALLATSGNGDRAVGEGNQNTRFRRRRSGAQVSWNGECLQHHIPSVSDEGADLRSRWGTIHGQSA